MKTIKLKQRQTPGCKLLVAMLGLLVFVMMLAMTRMRPGKPERCERVRSPHRSYAMHVAHPIKHSSQYDCVRMLLAGGTIMPCAGVSVHAFSVRQCHVCIHMRQGS